ncbi:hypothetical protein [Pararhodobacter sp. CCB-MM2]|uniref:hypothetical protein n=1 Tax=Pararhodobacter sp. CCB-MM2 TaxID=1786003 RepID=UPI000832C8A8|nr:hypothetical protein [Pararhodobacter sp. CCB-MM2]
MSARRITALLALLLATSVQAQVSDEAGPGDAAPEVQSAEPVTVVAAVPAPEPSPPPDPVLYQYTGPMDGEAEGVLVDGRSGHIARFQHALNVALMACGLEGEIGTDGMFGPRTRAAITRLAGCAPFDQRLTPDSPAREGAITEGLWQLLVPGEAPPDALARTRAILLAFEGTDITRGAQWNFCQNNIEIYDPEAEDPTCYTNDRFSYLTWGPNGATAGHGREILAILHRTELLDPTLLDAAFDDEAEAVRRLFDLRLPAGDDSEMRQYLCGIYVDLPRRRQWTRGFARLGERPEVRAIYTGVYRSASYDGGKIRTFLRAWRDAGLEPTEIDLAFFIDRAAHTSVRNIEVRRLLRQVLARGSGLTPAQIRRGFSRLARVANATQQGPRQGRDVAFYVDALEPVLTAPERRNWERSGARRASALGLSDDRPAPEIRIGPRDAWQATGLRPLTHAEADLCPAPVLNPSLPRRR